MSNDSTGERYRSVVQPRGMKLEGSLNYHVHQHEESFKACCARQGSHPLLPNTNAQPASFFSALQIVGCDLELGSTAKEDNCGVCNGDGSSCRLVRGHYKSQHSAGKSEWCCTLFRLAGSCWWHTDMLHWGSHFVTCCLGVEQTQDANTLELVSFREPLCPIYHILCLLEWF